MVVGPHALLSEDVQFANLGLAVVDEQHRFGVRQRIILGQKGTGVDVIVMTVHPPRVNGELNRYDEGFFHVSTLAGKALAEGGLSAVLLAKTGSIVAEYKREFYLPATSTPINSHVVAITGFTHKYLLDVYKIPEANASLCYRLRAGGAGLHHPSLPHRAGPNRTARPRRVIVLRYMCSSELTARDGGKLRDWRDGSWFARA